MIYSKKKDYCNKWYRIYRAVLQWRNAGNGHLSGIFKMNGYQRVIILKEFVPICENSRRNVDYQFGE